MAFAFQLAAPYITAMLTCAVLGFAQLVIIDMWGARRGAELRDLLMKWDAAWLTGIADHGYLRVPGRDPFESVAFFPGYPTLVRMVAAPFEVFGVDDATLLAAMIVSMTSSILLACGLARLAIDVAQRLNAYPLGTAFQIAVAVAVTVIAFGAPMSIMYWMPYSEALFTALTVWALVALLRRRYVIAGMLVLFAGLTRLTAIALVVVLCVSALVELWRYGRAHGTFMPIRFPGAALAAPVVGSTGLVAYLAWASYHTRSEGGYFAVQDHGWGSAFDWSSSTWEWLRHNTISSSGDANTVGYLITSWSMILVAGLCLATLRPLLRGRLPWQVWLPGVTAAAIVLGSGGTMHARPRLLLFATLLMLVPMVVLAIARLGRRTDWRLAVGVAALTATLALWCCLGFWVSGHMLIDFEFGI
ncbi:mannosyltransferase family protein [Gordonia amicalis]|uniref:mannosyltransferase family protein n=1 Tax=Gordonia amicalis TaxID=89053 RepID=UPI0024B99C40|nr:mannosyltransferase family protein [Gordonia amicalis]MDJ0454097.1 mannosyltransferase family protein [Gordonia amicalis]MDV7077241.1 mannosyltransferase family protein [Gordonia amicalis]